GYANPPAWPGRCDLRRVQPALLDQLADGRPGALQRGDTLTPFAPLGTLSGSAGEGGPRRGSGGVGEGPHGAIGDPAEHRADRHAVALLGEDLGERAGSRRRNLEGHLVGFELGDRLIERDRLARP